jgi:hypothetical protein
VENPSDFFLLSYQKLSSNQIRWDGTVPAGFAPELSCKQNSEWIFLLNENKCSTLRIKELLWSAYAQGKSRNAK